MGFDLESEPDATCPLCASHPEYDDHDVQVKPNKAGDPFFSCDRLRVSVNIRENGTEFLDPFVSGDAESLAQPPDSSEGDGGGQTLADVLNSEGSGE